MRMLIVLALAPVWLMVTSLLVRDPGQGDVVRVAGPPSRQAAASVRVLTWNIHSSLLDRIEEELAEARADVIALQEVSATPAEVRRLAERLGMEAAFLPLMIRKRPFGLAVLTNLPVQGVRYRLLPSGREPRAYLVVETPELYIVNTHLEPSPRRRWQLELLRRDLEALDKPAVLLGDLNEEGLGSYFEGFEDAGREAGITYPALQARIDYVLVRGRPAGGARVTPTPKSDHYPVVAVLHGGGDCP